MAASRRTLLLVALVVVGVFIAAVLVIFTRGSKNSSTADLGPVNNCNEQTVAALTVTACSYGSETVVITASSGGLLIAQGRLTPGNTVLPVRTLKSQIRANGTIEADFPSGDAVGVDREVVLRGKWTAKRSSDAQPVTFDSQIMALQLGASPTPN